MSSKKLIITADMSAMDARNAPSLGLVYSCPVCRSGSALRPVIKGEKAVVCGKCGGRFEKP